MDNNLLPVSFDPVANNPIVDITLGNTGDMPLTDIPNSYNQAASQFNDMTQRMVDDLGQRQIDLVGNNFGGASESGGLGIGNYNERTYIEPGTTGFQSTMRVMGTQKALEEGQRRGKEEAENRLRNAQNNYNNALTNYQNEQQRMRELNLVEPDNTKLPEGTTAEEAKRIFSTDRAEALGASIDAAFRDYNVDWSTQETRDIRKIATAAIKNEFGDTPDWNNADVGNAWKKKFYEEYAKAKGMNMDPYYKDGKQYLGSYASRLAMAETIAAYGDAVLEGDDWKGMTPLALLDKFSVTGFNPDRIMEFLENTKTYTRDGDSVQDAEWVAGVARQIQDYIDEGKASPDMQEMWEKGGIKDIVLRGETDRNGDLVLRFDNRNVVVDKSKVSNFFTKYGHVVSEEIEYDAKQFFSSALGYEVSDVLGILNLRDSDPDGYELLRKSNVEAMALGIGLADGKTQYFNGKEYITPEEGETVMYIAPGARDPNTGEITDPSLRRVMELWKMQGQVGAPEDLFDQISDEYDKYRKRYTTALVLTENLEGTITNDIWNAILSNEGDLGETVEVVGATEKAWADRFNDLSDRDKYLYYSAIIGQSAQISKSFIATGKNEDEARGLYNQSIKQSDGEGGEVDAITMEAVDRDFGWGKVSDLSQAEATAIHLMLKAGMDRAHNGNNRHAIQAGFMRSLGGNIAWSKIGNTIQGTGELFKILGTGIGGLFSGDFSEHEAAKEDYATVTKGEWGYESNVAMEQSENVTRHIYSNTPNISDLAEYDLASVVAESVKNNNYVGAGADFGYNLAGGLVGMGTFAVETGLSYLLTKGAATVAKGIKGAALAGAAKFFGGVADDVVGVTAKNVMARVATNSLDDIAISSVTNSMDDIAKGITRAVSTNIDDISIKFADDALEAMYGSNLKSMANTATTNAARETLVGSLREVGEQGARAAAVSTFTNLADDVVSSIGKSALRVAFGAVDDVFRAGLQGAAKQSSQTVIKGLVRTAATAAKKGAVMTTDDALRYIAQNGTKDMAKSAARQAFTREVVAETVRDIGVGIFNEATSASGTAERTQRSQYDIGDMGADIIGNMVLFGIGRQAFNSAKLHRTRMLTDKARNALAVNPVDSVQYQKATKNLAILNDKVKKLETKALSSLNDPMRFREATEAVNDLVEKQIVKQTDIMKKNPGMATNASAMIQKIQATDPPTQRVITMTNVIRTQADTRWLSYVDKLKPVKGMSNEATASIELAMREAADNAMESTKNLPKLERHKAIRALQRETLSSLPVEVRAAYRFYLSELDKTIPIIANTAGDNAWRVGFLPTTGLSIIDQDPVPAQYLGLASSRTGFADIGSSPITTRVDDWTPIVRDYVQTGNKTRITGPENIPRDINPNGFNPLTSLVSYQNKLDSDLLLYPLINKPFETGSAVIRNTKVRNQEIDKMIVNLQKQINDLGDSTSFMSKLTPEETSEWNKALADVSIALSRGDVIRAREAQQSAQTALIDLQNRRGELLSVKGADPMNVSTQQFTAAYDAMFGVLGRIEISEEQFKERYQKIANDLLATKKKIMDGNGGDIRIISKYFDADGNLTTDGVMRKVFENIADGTTRARQLPGLETVDSENVRAAANISSVQQGGTGRTKTPDLAREMPTGNAEFTNFVGNHNLRKWWLFEPLFSSDYKISKDRLNQLTQDISKAIRNDLVDGQDYETELARQLLRHPSHFKALPDSMIAKFKRNMVYLSVHEDLRSEIAQAIYMRTTNQSISTRGLSIDDFFSADGAALDIDNTAVDLLRKSFDAKGQGEMDALTLFDAMTEPRTTRTSAEALDLATDLSKEADDSITLGDTIASQPMTETERMNLSDDDMSLINASTEGVSPMGTVMSWDLERQQNAWQTLDNIAAKLRQDSTAATKANNAARTAIKKADISADAAVLKAFNSSNDAVLNTRVNDAITRRRATGARAAGNKATASDVWEALGAPNKSAQSGGPQAAWAKRIIEAENIARQQGHAHGVFTTPDGVEQVITPREIAAATRILQSTDTAARTSARASALRRFAMTESGDTKALLLQSADALDKAAADFAQNSAMRITTDVDPINGVTRTLTSSELENNILDTIDSMHQAHLDTRARNAIGEAVARTEVAPTSSVLTGRPDYDQMVAEAVQSNTAAANWRGPQPGPSVGYQDIAQDITEVAENNLGRPLSIPVVEPAYGGQGAFFDIGETTINDYTTRFDDYRIEQAGKISEAELDEEFKIVSDAINELYNSSRYNTKLQYARGDGSMYTELDLVDDPRFDTSPEGREWSERTRRTPEQDRQIRANEVANRMYSEYLAETGYLSDTTTIDRRIAQLEKDIRVLQKEATRPVPLKKTDEAKALQNLRNRLNKKYGVSRKAQNDLALKSKQIEDLKAAKADPSKAFTTEKNVVIFGSDADTLKGYTSIDIFTDFDEAEPIGPMYRVVSNRRARKANRAGDNVRTAAEIENLNKIRTNIMNNINKSVEGVSPNDVFVAENFVLMHDTLDRAVGGGQKMLNALFSLNGFNNAVQNMHLTGGVSTLNAFTLRQFLSAMWENGPLDLQSNARMMKTFFDARNMQSVRAMFYDNREIVAKLTFLTGDDTIPRLFADVNAKGTEFGAGFMSETYRNITDWNRTKVKSVVDLDPEARATKAASMGAINPKQIEAADQRALSIVDKGKIATTKDIIGQQMEIFFNDPTFQRFMPSLYLNKFLVEHQSALRFMNRNTKKLYSKVNEELFDEMAIKLAWYRTKIFFEPSAVTDSSSIMTYLKSTFGRIDLDDADRTVWGKMMKNLEDVVTGRQSSTNVLDVLKSFFFAIDYKSTQIGRLLNGFKGFKKGEAGYIHGGARNSLLTVLGIIGTAAVYNNMTGNTANYDDPAKMLTNLQYFGQFWLPGGIKIDPFFSMFTLPNTFTRTFQGVVDPGSKKHNWQRRFDFGPGNAIMDELIGSNLLAPYKATWEVLTNQTYFGNNIWEKEFLNDGTVNPNFDNFRNNIASILHFLNLDGILSDRPGTNAWVKGENSTYDVIGTVGGSGILQHEFLTAYSHIKDGNFLEAAVEAMELPIKFQNIKSVARTNLNVDVMNDLREMKNNYDNIVAETDSTSTKTEAYKDFMTSAIERVREWDKKYKISEDVDGNRDMIDHMARVLTAFLADEYDDNLNKVQSAFWKAKLDSKMGDDFALSASQMRDDETEEEFNKRRNESYKHYNRQLDKEYEVRQQLKELGIDSTYFTSNAYDDVRSAYRGVHKDIITQIDAVLTGKINGYPNFKDMKKNYEQRIATYDNYYTNAYTARTKKAEAANEYNQMLFDAITPFVEKYGVGILDDVYYEGQGLGQKISDYVIIPANKLYTGKNPQRSYLSDQFGIGYRNRSNMPTQEEVTKEFMKAKDALVSGAAAKAMDRVNRILNNIKAGKWSATGKDYSEILQFYNIINARTGGN